MRIIEKYKEAFSSEIIKNNKDCFSSEELTELFIMESLTRYFSYKLGKDKHDFFWGDEGLILGDISIYPDSISIKEICVPVVDFIELKNHFKKET